MTDILLANDGTAWRAVFDADTADVVLTHTRGRQTEVGQRSIWHFCTWRGELWYAPSDGIPWADAVFGVTPIPGVAALLTFEAGQVEGVAEIESASYLLDEVSRSLAISIVQRPTDADSSSAVLITIGG